ncbi:putative Spermidine/putrescine ABC transporter substrate-binding protein [Azospirillaceae bacterium]
MFGIKKEGVKIRIFIFIVIMVGGSIVFKAASAKEIISIYNWEDYLSPALISEFEQQTGAEVKLDFFQSYDEMLNRISSPDHGVDIFFPANHMIQALIKDKLIARVTPSVFAGFENIDDGWRFPYYDPYGEYSLPFHWGTTAIQVDDAVIKDIVKENGESLSLIFNPPVSLRGRIGLLYETDETVSMALHYLGLPSCADRPEQMERLRVLFSSLVGAVVIMKDPLLPQLLAETTVVRMAWNGDALRAREKRPSLRYIYPREGALVWADAIVVAQNAPHPDLARKFMAFMLDARRVAAQTNFTRYANAIRDSEKYIDPVLLTAPEVAIPASAKLHFYHGCSAKTTAIHEAFWSEMREILQKNQRKE